MMINAAVVADASSKQKVTKFSSRKLDGLTWDRIVSKK